MELVKVRSRLFVRSRNASESVARRKLELGNPAKDGSYPNIMMCRVLFLKNMNEVFEHLIADACNDPK